MADYITKDDITNINFNKTSESVRDLYVSYANKEIEDLAERLGVMDVTEIVTPIHYKIKKWAINMALSLYSQDLIGANSIDIGYVDLYKDMFERSQYLINQQQPDITYEMLTGTVTSRSDRTTSFGRVVRG